MAEVLGRVERCLLLAGSPRSQPEEEGEGGAGPAGGGLGGGELDGGGLGGEGRDGLDEGSCAEDDGSAAGWSTGLPTVSARAEAEPRLRGAELGEFALQLHSYLLLLDFSSPAYPTKASDALHRGVQDMLRQGQLSVPQQRALLRSLKEHHGGLAKFLR